MRVLVAYDGTVQAREALRYGIQKARETDGDVIALHVFDSNLFIDYDSLPWAKEVARKESLRFVEDAKKLLEEHGAGIRSRIVTEEGNPEEEIIRYAKERNIDILLCPPRYKKVIKGFRKMLRDEGKDALEDSLFDESARLKMAVVSMQ